MAEAMEVVRNWGFGIWFVIWLIWICRIRMVHRLGPSRWLGQVKWYGGGDLTFINWRSGGEVQRLRVCGLEAVGMVMAGILWLWCCGLMWMLESTGLVAWVVESDGEVVRWGVAVSYHGWWWGLRGLGIGCGLGFSPCELNGEALVRRWVIMKREKCRWWTWWWWPVGKGWPACFGFTYNMSTKQTLIE